MFTKRHFEAVADTIAGLDVDDDTRLHIGMEFCTMFAADNERFRADVFRARAKALTADEREKLERVQHQLKS